MNKENVIGRVRERAALLRAKDYGLRGRIKAYSGKDSDMSQRF